MDSTRWQATAGVFCFKRPLILLSWHMLCRVLILLLIPVPAFADCFAYCTGLCHSNPGGLDFQTCQNRCTNTCIEEDGNYRFTAAAPPAVTASIAQKNGAIALSPSTLGSGHAFGYLDAAKASTEALQRCHDDTPAHPADCKIILTFANSCAALAILPKPDGGGTWGTAWADSKEEAESKALTTCAVTADANCSISFEFCSQ